MNKEEEKIKQEPVVDKEKSDLREKFDQLKLSSPSVIGNSLLMVAIQIVFGLVGFASLSALFYFAFVDIPEMIKMDRTFFMTILVMILLISSLIMRLAGMVRRRTRYIIELELLITGEDNNNSN